MKNYGLKKERYEVALESVSEIEKNMEMYSLPFLSSFLHFWSNASSLKAAVNLNT